jgi:hypothetical protein
MTAKRSQNTQSKVVARRQQNPSQWPRWRRILLSLTLVPLIIGVLLIGAWALEMDLLGSMEDQIVVGTLFLLFSFAASNALQEKWSLTAGWALLMLADWMILAGREVWLQVVGFIVAATGVILVGAHYVRGIRRDPDQTKAGQ